MARCSRAEWGAVWLGEAGQGEAWQGVETPLSGGVSRKVVVPALMRQTNEAWPGRAWRGLARPGSAGPGWA